jgi:hypothetical protein
MKITSEAEKPLFMTRPRYNLGELASNANGKATPTSITRKYSLRSYQNTPDSAYATLSNCSGRFIDQAQQSSIFSLEKPSDLNKSSKKESKCVSTQTSKIQFCANCEKNVSVIVQKDTTESETYSHEPRRQMKNLKLKRHQSDLQSNKMKYESLRENMNQSKLRTQESQSYLAQKNYNSKHVDLENMSVRELSRFIDDLRVKFRLNTNLDYRIQQRIIKHQSNPTQNNNMSDILSDKSQQNEFNNKQANSTYIYFTESIEITDSFMTQDKDSFNSMTNERINNDDNIRSYLTSSQTSTLTQQTSNTHAYMDTKRNSNKTYKCDTLSEISDFENENN